MFFLLRIDDDAIVDNGEREFGWQRNCECVRGREREREWQTAAPGIECVCDVRVFERESARVRSRDTCV